MRKAVITCVACILLSAVMAGSRPAGSGDLQIVRAMVVETGQEEKAVYVDKKTEMRTFHHYLVYCLLKNTGTEKITVFTDFSGIKDGSLSPTIGKGGDGKPGTRASHDCAQQNTRHTGDYSFSHRFLLSVCPTIFIWFRIRTQTTLVLQHKNPASKS